MATGFPGYNSIIPKDAATVGEILKENGYATSWFGKNHNTPAFAPVRPDHSTNGRSAWVLNTATALSVATQPVAAEPIPQHNRHLSVSQ
jgi:arylsulfatase A-like enzyme